MHLPNLLEERFTDALAGITDEPAKYASMIRSTNDPKHGDYQANGVMPLSKAVGRTPREVAAEVIERLKVDDLCETPEVAGPGFINLRLRDSVLADHLSAMLGDRRCGVAQQPAGGNIVVDFSSPNVAKPMHVGHIRSTVIGDALARTLSFLGHPVITDNHLGDWGTQFGIIIYGYKHFGDPETVAANPVPELAKLYRHVNQLIEYRKAEKSKSQLVTAVETCKAQLSDARDQQRTAEGKEAKKLGKLVGACEKKLLSAQTALASAETKIAAVQSDEALMADAKQHADVDQAVLNETAKLHAGDPENLELWTRFLPYCKDEINRVYERLNVQFDHTLGESFYHPMLANVVDDLQRRGLASTSDGAMCVFLDQFDAPMIVRKKDGAFLYATTDLATLNYRRETFDPSEIIYVVDTRQSEHFDKLFAVAKHLGMDEIKLVHVNFGTVLGDDGKPMKTRSGTLIGLEGLLDDAVDRARKVVCNPERLANFEPPMSVAEQENIAETVGIGAIKFADLSHHRTSDYRFDLDKMVALEGNTSAYVQYSYARTQNILQRAEKAESDVAAMVKNIGIEFSHPAERALALVLMKFEESLVTVHKDYAPNVLVDYLLETAKTYSKFNDSCHVLRAETEISQATRLALVTLTGRVLETGLSLLGIGVSARM